MAGETGIFSDQHLAPALNIPRVKGLPVLEMYRGLVDVFTKKGTTELLLYQSLACDILPKASPLCYS